jgi:fumarate reductase subunit D
MKPQPPFKRSHVPILWALFGAGGMLAALFGPMLVLITGIAVPLGWLPASIMDYRAIHALAHGAIGKVVLFFGIGLLLWHAAHRIYHSLHDIGIHGGPVARALTYGVAALGTLITLWAVLAV